ncbi:hypothetical protein ONS96_011373 [Cadophora gregata f. sp. sojae]|nr:hypothetical protein ONS96_011373 [Cadophora gregata f. sp. sojae]
MQLLAAPKLVSFWAVRGISTSTSTSRWPWTSSRIAKCRRSARQISSDSAASSREGFEVQKFEVKCGSAGFVTIDVHNPSALSNPANPLIIHLPPTGTHLRSTHPPLPPYLLTSKTTLASINYRWNIPTPSTNTTAPKPLSNNPSYAYHPFPRPLHDTLAGYTFLLSTFLPRYSPQAPSPTTDFNPNARQSLYAPTRPLPVQRPILMYGSFLGGTLATSLALTENFTSRTLPTKIIGLITKNAVFDWTDIATSPPPPTVANQDSSSENELGSTAGPLQRSPMTPENAWDASTLHKLKTHLFPSPAAAFDSFASPTLFFRTSGLAVPQKWVTDEDSSDQSTANSPSLSPSETEDQWPSEEGDLTSSNSEAASPLTPGEEPTSPTHKQTETTEADLAKRISQLFIEPPSRPAHLKFPPSSTTLKIPFSLFLHTATSLPSSSSTTSSLSSSTSPKTKSKSKSRSKLKAQRRSNEGPDGEDTTTTPGGQANHMATLFRRSVFIHEFSDRRIWDEELDPEAASQARARVVGIRGEGSGGVGEEGRRGDIRNGDEQGKSEGEAVGEWINDIFG